ncbi:MAG: deoxyguanosinetriphosphate triphosphohydrolase [Desulfobacterales bacterium]|nr:MAG: deoxyguanosinetriphosphate triphosphohydrolase [Desulfobacterales bacterium]
MTIRDEYEDRERGFMSPYGCLSSESRGRRVHEPERSVRTGFQVDRDRIVYSNAFRRMKYKTQVFLAPLGDQYRTRLTHTLEVAQIARAVARGLYLNEDLVEAIALGHDLGHTPFGHGGESVLKEVFSPSFAHNEQSLRVVDYLENKGRGLNLTHEVRDGILKHSKGSGEILPDNPEDLPVTVEGRIVRYADIMAYLNHDLEDAVRSGVIRESDVPVSCRKVMGRDHFERATNMMRDMIFSSRESNDGLRPVVSEDMHAAMMELRAFLYENVYRSEPVHREFVKARRILTDLYNYFIDSENGERLYQELTAMDMAHLLEAGWSYDRVVADLVSSMTDRYVMTVYTRIFFPSPLV